MPPVIPTFEGAHPSHGLCWIREAVREREMILERLEGRFRKRIVIRDPGSRAARGDPEPQPQVGEGLSDHWPTVVLVHRELLGRNLPAMIALAEELLGERCTLVFSDQPTDEIAAVEIEYEIQVQGHPP